MRLFLNLLRHSFLPLLGALFLTIGQAHAEKRVVLADESSIDNRSYRLTDTPKGSNAIAMPDAVPELIIAQIPAGKHRYRCTAYSGNVDIFVMSKTELYQIRTQDYHNCKRVR